MTHTHGESSRPRGQLSHPTKKRPESAPKYKKPGWTCYFPLPRPLDPLDLEFPPPKLPRFEPPPRLLRPEKPDAPLPRFIDGEEPRPNDGDELRLKDGEGLRPNDWDELRFIDGDALRWNDCEGLRFIDGDALRWNDGVEPIDRVLGEREN